MPYLDRNYLSVWGGGGGRGGSDATTTANAATIVGGGGGYVGSSSSSSPSSWLIVRYLGMVQYVRDPEFYDDYGANRNRNRNDAMGEGRGGKNNNNSSGGGGSRLSERHPLVVVPHTVLLGMERDGSSSPPSR